MILQGVPKKIGILSSFEFLELGGVFLGIKNNSNNFGNKNNSRFFGKILRKWTLFVRKMKKIMWIFEFIAMLRMEIFLSGIKVNIYADANMIIEYYDI